MSSAGVGQEELELHSLYCCSCPYKPSPGCWLRLIPFASLWPPALLVLPFGLATCESLEFPSRLFSGLLFSPLWVAPVMPPRGYAPTYLPATA